MARSGQDAVRALARVFRGFAHEHPGQFASTLLPPVDALDTLAEAQAQARIVDLFEAVMHSLDLDGEQAIHGARLARSAIHGFVSLEAIDAMTSPVDHTASFERLIEFTIARVTSRRRGAPEPRTATRQVTPTSRRGGWEPPATVSSTIEDDADATVSSTCRSPLETQQ